jgi:L-ascorbate metabolism protein UlaG (beta-lactamase superfamily)
MTERIVDPSRLNFINVVTSSHNHTDHLDAETLVPLMKANPNLRMVIPEADRAFVTERLGCELDWPLGLDAGESVGVAGGRIHGVPAAHETLERDAEGRCVFMGYVAEFGPFRVYHSGDTVLYEGMEDVLRPFAVDVALLPINGAKPERRVAGNLDEAEAARLAKAIAAGLVVPCHYNMFEFNTATPDLFERTCRELGQAYTILRAGERRTIRK